ncbi:Target of EGR1, member 1 (Nuclear) [Rhizophlyctis rosea]|uniref:Target of EGR1, member 1 (Nuclear) n=1 Tax=Rhizophlyctis rosea TaxID=64517 RepID=A0AAD5X3Z2_9FUNG|nr:Target of EGR1, member 1 (Nuclear) [Rhizophlyctis rosea]
MSETKSVTNGFNPPMRPAVIVPTFNQVTRHNLVSLYTIIKHKIDNAHHLAFDTEFTGLGQNANTRAQNIEDRYIALSTLAKTHALVAFGLTTFEAMPSSSSSGNSDDQDALEVRYAVHNFNFLMLNQNEYAVNADSMQFLADNGFDFNEQFTSGIPYSPGDDSFESSAEWNSTDSNHIMRSIFLYILERKVPIILHNGLLDLLFVYHSFYASLPHDLSAFTAALSEMFPAGIYDTKYIADFHSRERASFLAYLFRKSEREELDRKMSNLKHVVCNIQDRLPPQNNSVSVTFTPARPGKRKQVDTGKPYCEQYAGHGFCNEGRNCNRSHDLDVILDAEMGKANGNDRPKKKQKIEIEPLATSGGSDGDHSHDANGLREFSGKSEPASQGPDGADFMNLTNSIPESIPSPTQSIPANLQPEPRATKAESAPQPSDATLFEKYHSACFDAYMTGYIWAHQLLLFGKEKMETYQNCMYLIGKQFPLRIEKSKFAKTSSGHRSKRERILAGKRVFGVDVRKE